MRIESELTIKRVDAGNDGKVPQSEVLLAGKSTGALVSGAVLEAAVQYENFYLLFLTDDIPYEEMLRIVLLDKQLKLLDSAVIGGPYSTGSFSGLSLTEPNTIRFNFIGDTDWHVELLSRPQFRIPFISEPTGVWRSFGFSRHFIVRGKPRPEEA